MKDIHSHLIPGIDDGCTDFDESIKLLKAAEESGITDIVLTPHYIEYSDYNSTNAVKKKKLKELKERVKEEGIDINLYLGNEVYITDNVVELIKKKKIATINDSRYVLVELPLGQEYLGASEVLFKLISKGYIPILAHPERYLFLQNDPNVVEDLLKMGILLQGNYLSLFNKYGRKARKILKLYLKRGWITVLGSDVHHSPDFHTDKLRKRIKRIVKDDKKVEDLLENNFNMIINDQVIDKWVIQ